MKVRVLLVLFAFLLSAYAVAQDSGRVQVFGG